MAEILPSRPGPPNPVDKEQDPGSIYETKSWSHVHTIEHPFGLLPPTRPSSPVSKDGVEIAAVLADLEVLSRPAASKQPLVPSRSSMKLLRKSESRADSKPDATLKKPDKAGILTPPISPPRMTSSPTPTIKQLPASLQNDDSPMRSDVPNRHSRSATTSKSRRSPLRAKSAPISTSYRPLRASPRRSLALPVADPQPVHSNSNWRPPPDATKQHLDSFLKSVNLSVVVASPHPTARDIQSMPSFPFPTLADTNIPYAVPLSLAPNFSSTSSLNASQSFTSDALGTTTGTTVPQTQLPFTSSHDSNLSGTSIAGPQQMQQEQAVPVHAYSQQPFPMNTNHVPGMADPKLPHVENMQSTDSTSAPAAFTPAFPSNYALPLTSSFPGGNYPSSSSMLPPFVHNANNGLAGYASSQNQDAFSSPMIHPQMVAAPHLLPHGVQENHHPSTSTTLEAGKRWGKFALQLAGGALVASASVTPVGGAALVGGAVTQRIVGSLGTKLVGNAQANASQGLVGSLISGVSGTDQQGVQGSADQQLQNNHLLAADTMQPLLVLLHAQLDAFKYQQQMFHQSQVQMQMYMQTQMQMQMQHHQMQIQMMQQQQQTKTQTRSVQHPVQQQNGQLGHPKTSDLTHSQDMPANDLDHSTIQFDPKISQDVPTTSSD